MPNSIKISLKLVVALAFAAVMAGCTSAKTEPAAVAEPVAPPPPPPPPAPVVEVAEPEPEPAPEPVPVPEPLMQWTVAAGNHLWGISGTWEVFNLSEKWPLLYKANMDQIKDPDLIYPGQVLDIPRDSSESEINAAIDHAKTRGAWAVGPVESSDKAYLEKS